MSRADRRLLTLWLALTAAAALALFFNIVIVALMLTVIGIPLALLLLATPTLWLYLTPTLLTYGVTRRFTRSGRVLFGLPALATAATLALGIVIPTVANRATERQVESLVAQDGGGPVTLPRGASVTYLVDRGLGSTDGKCLDTCQRLLFTGAARSYTEGTLDLLPRLGRLTEPLLRHAIVPAARGCTDRWLQGSHAEISESGGRVPPPLLWDALDDLAEQGLCYRVDRVMDARADYLMVSQNNFVPGRRTPRFDWSLRPARPFRRWEIYRMGSGHPERVMRRTQVDYFTLAIPLAIVPPLRFDIMSSGHWRRVQHRWGFEPTYSRTGWQPWITNDLTVDGLAD